MTRTPAPAEFTALFDDLTDPLDLAEHDAAVAVDREAAYEEELGRQREFTLRLSGYVAGRLAEEHVAPDMQICHDTSKMVPAFRFSTKKESQLTHTLLPEEGWIVKSGMNHPDHGKGSALLRPDGSVLLIGADDIQTRGVRETPTATGAARGAGVKSLMHLDVEGAPMLTQLSDHTEDDAAFQWRSETKIAGAPHHKFAVPYSLEDRVFQEKKLQEALANVLISRGINRGRATGPTTGPTPAPGTTPPAPPMPSTGLAAPSFEARVPGGTYVDPEAAERARKIKDFLEYLRNLNANRGNSTDPTPESPVVDFPLPPAPSTSTAEPTVFAITSVGAPEADPAAEKKAKRGEYWDKVKMVASETFVIGLELVAGKYSNRPAVALSSTSVPDILNTLVKHKYFDERARQQGYTTTEAIQGMPAEKRDSLWSTLMNDSEIKKDAGKIFLDLVKMAVVSRKSEKFLSGAVQKTAADILKLREDCLEVLAEEKAAKARGTRS